MIIFFCINCVIIADKFRILAKQIKKMPQQSTTRHLLELQSDHLLLCQSVQLLNVTFGPVLLLEILFVSIGFTNTIMKILLKTNSFGLVLILRVIFIVSYSTNLILICNSAELIRTEVIISYCWNEFHLFYWLYLITYNIEKAKNLKLELYNLTRNKPSLLSKVITRN